MGLAGGSKGWACKNVGYKEGGVGVAVIAGEG